MANVVYLYPPYIETNHFIPNFLLILLDIRAEMMPDELPDRSEISKFDHSKLKHVNTTEKVVLPSKEGQAMVKEFVNISVFELILFIPSALCKNLFFNQADVKEEAINSRAEVKSFDHNKLKHVKTQEKVTLPGAGGQFFV